jgi:GNAT superfamily N-acetyltransferase
LFLGLQFSGCCATDNAPKQCLLWSGKKAEVTEIKLVTNKHELEGILQLQKANLSRLISREEAEAEGFVTAEYTLDFLQQMHAAGPSVIAVADNTVVGYALVAAPAIKGGHALLDDLFEAVDNIVFKNKRLAEQPYVLVGQLCVAKTHRRQGLAGRLYEYYKQQYSAQYEYCITDVVTSNQQSLLAHQKSGFEVIRRFSYGGDEWDIVLWDWRNK